jgi:hypothetical protein
VAVPILLALATAALIVADVTVYADRSLFNSDRFADRAASALDQRSVRGLLADRFAGEAVKVEPDLIGARPLLVAAAEGITSAEPFHQVFRSAVVDLHQTVFEADQDTVALDLADAGVLLIEGLRSLAPRLADKVPANLEPELVALSDNGPGGLLADGAQVAHEVREVSLIAALVTVLLLAMALVISTNRRRTTRAAALCVTGVGVGCVVVFEVGRAVAAARLDNTVGGDAVRELWDVFLLDFRTWNLVLAASGLVVVAATASFLKPLPIARARGVVAWLSRPPETSRGRALRGLGLVAAGLVVVIAPSALLLILTVALGVLLLYSGAIELLRLVLPPQEARERAERTPRRQSRRRVVLVPALAALAVIALAVAIGAGTDDPAQPPFEIRSCNGAAHLCDRRLDQVVFPSTHNSFSSADQPRWLFGQHEEGIPQQLQAGIRGLLIDTHHGVPTDKGVYTVLDRDSASRKKIEEPLGERFVDTAEQLRERIGFRGDGADPEVFLCHGFCETGAIKAEPALKRIRDFLVRNPYEVLMVSIENDIPLENVQQAFDASGLSDMVWDQQLRSGRFPTLREMIEADRRVAVLVWQRGPLGQAGFGDIPWMNRQFGLVQETPYEFKNVAEVVARDSCRPNEGDPDNPLFLLNNWVDSSPVFLPSNARKVNAYDTLLERARMCQRIRGRLPTLIAVDFFQEGDVVGVARELNR